MTGLSAVAERLVASPTQRDDTQLIEDTRVRAAPSSRGLVIFNVGTPTGGQFGYRAALAEKASSWPTVLEWARLAAQAHVFFPTRLYEDVELRLDNDDFTFSVFAPSVRASVGTGCTLDELRRAIPSVWQQPIATIVQTPATVEEAPIVIDIPEELTEARAKAGLPVQDLAAMFGIKRRQFYNLVSGDDVPDTGRERRIALVVDALRRISDQVGGNSRKVRTLVLARLDGDSVYDAAVADDADRVERALARAVGAAADTHGLRRRSAPSNRSTRDEAAGVRAFLSATRDDTVDEDADA